ncbi:glycosyltransferase involved in cell wall biosynthesis [Luteimonas cucumeris]|uniref:Glycosyltransferase involved in cell wall biosynthesis n=1 Tax=Luteimonas cucumeris TaxID=985012 RepID=A0A562LE33_9GAMM|nr:glycosyltransferase family 2 protein [Luteimonas cucumeris]TWI05949.1 glycosyltransferase involved in cell wall biosynthesis [Luteimonas cucumeris]
MRCSLLVTTYNWKQALAAVLASVRRQTRLPDEVIVADDGSREDTRDLLLARARDFPTALRHVWQQDLGFRAASIRNRAIAASRGDYVVCIDGDMVLHPDFIADHLALSETGSFLQGGRLQATADYTRRLLAGERPSFAPWMPVDFTATHGDERRHSLRWPWMARHKARSAHAGVTVMSCNMSFWRADLIRVNGFDERMEGYGSEDLEIDARLRNANVRRRRLKFAGLAVHLLHDSRAPVDPEDLSLPNNRVLQETIRHATTRCELGINQYIDEYRLPLPDLRDAATVN